MRSKARDPLSAAFKPLTPISPEAQASGIAVVEHINRLLAPSHFQLKGCAWSPFGNFIATPHLSEDVAKLPEVLPRILLDMFKVEFCHLTFDNSSFVVVYNLPLGPPGNWADPSTIALALMAQNNILEPLPASPGRWLANPDRHKGTTASLRLSLSPLMKAAILRSGTLFFDGRPHPVRAFTAVKTKPNQCRQCWRLGHSEAWCRQTNPVCGTCAQGHPSHHHHAVAPNAAQLCVLCKGAHPSWTRWCVNRHIQLAAQPPLPKKKPAKPLAASKRHASKVTARSSTNVPSSTTEPSEVWCRQTNPICGTCAQGHPSHHHHAVAPNAAQLCVLCKGAHPSWTRWCVNRHIQLAAQPPLPKKKPVKPSAASKRHASKVTAGSSTNVPSSTTEPSGDVVTHL
ncbi:hypothetical protein BOTBODRAFT_178712 [Botryobasidium botryosum FD-172 SS1]|uniref:Uncharacterized protein n=1 Tax=Botryobasidium botryosum (strain FD-172 SS1) TaxID=930990 RepID=A0A067M218_BOTB1|nr:hypothetical protein BOTBODRAFT_178712 [Botryobasidium botryosum FD-172 SS1]